ncbi:MAG: DUF952 domain-containing protein [Caulobacteraceae bacterium]
MSLIYKILPKADWRAAEVEGAYRGSPLDLKDGFIHLSDEAQWEETLRLHFAGQSDLVLVGFDAGSLGEALRWEPSRAGQLFPHLFGPLPTALAVSVREVA